MPYLIACKNKKREWGSFEVPEEVYRYIQQLEACIKYPDQSKLKEKYPERFMAGKVKT